MANHILKLTNDHPLVNKYIGLSFLSCALSSLYLDAEGFHYRGRSIRLYDNWYLPERFESTKFNLKLMQLSEDIHRNKGDPSLSSTIFIQKKIEIDKCQQTLQYYSDDICHIFEYLNKIIKMGNLYVEVIFGVDLKYVLSILLDARNSLVEQPCKHDTSMFAVS